MSSVGTHRRPGLATRSSSVSWRLASAGAFAALPVHAAAQVVTDVQRAPTLTIERYPEDWSHLADTGERTGRWTEQFKYIPLSENASTYLTTGVEVRSRYEGYENPLWGSAADDDYVWHRVMPYVDLHVGNVRAFAQPIVTAITGTDRPNTPVDTTGTDVLQAFAEAEFEVSGSTSLHFSGGRKLVSLGAGRFVDTRYGPNVPLAFDGGEIALTGGTAQLRAMYLRPVDTGSGDFNDRTSRQKAVWGLYATRWFGKQRTTGFDVYYLGFRDRHAIFDQGIAHQSIHTLGARFFGDTGRWYWNLEGALQRGKFGDKRVVAGGVGGELGYRFRDTPLQPVLALTLDYVSGDRDPNDGKLGTLNPMFPRGSYFAAQSPVGPRNVIHLQPSVKVSPRERVAVSLTGVAYWRESTRDGVYNIPGVLVRSGLNSDARFIGKQLELAVAWQATPELNLSTSVSAFEPGPFIRQTGSARTMKVAAAMANIRF
jgi:hypothetical protein